ncbi:hypothetical protein AU468_03010 [Alkalispirochaeta sphaeroplastigenens]|uniref:PEGA domain-containing protein n=1 Tax=Alkalispirochaeta sphaeroplastigenens TaxID=1187066 RepID=A0A2S4JYR0_9SPIO|nr:hypothetical protein [Alkalispirochaeta sphaeroplastigenens]POR04658.1 hypothetical protein AU468_03010 [Alkalispirochaeta sphaeroplastigenens]
MQKTIFFPRRGCSGRCCPVTLVAAFSFAVAMALSPPSLGGEEAFRTLRGEAIALVPFENPSDREALERVARELEEALKLTLQVSGQFDLRHLPPEAVHDRDSLLGLARDRRIDGLVLGELRDLSRGEVLLKISVLDVSRGVVLESRERRSYGDFDLDEAAREVLAEIASALLGYPVHYAALVFQPSREGVPYRVFLDGVSLGKSPRGAPHVPEGVRTLEITVATSRGEIPVYAADRLLRSGEVQEIPFALPGITSLEQREIQELQRGARHLLGDPAVHDQAWELLRESARLLAAVPRDRLEPLRREQKGLELLWELDREFSRLAPENLSRRSDWYTPGDPLRGLAVTERVQKEDPGSGATTPPVRRNALALFRLLELRWAQSLAEEAWDEAALVLEDLAAVDRFFHLGETERLAGLRQDYLSLLVRVEGQRDRSRVLPLLGVGAGLGGVAGGSYLLVTDVASDYSDSPGPLFDWSESELVDMAAGGLIVAGGVLAVVSAVRLIRGRSSVDGPLRDWSREEQGQMISAAEDIFSWTPGPGQGARVVILGPPGEIVSLGDRIVTMPALVPAEQGRAFSVHRPFVVSRDRTRLVPEGVSIIVVD